MLLVIDNYDSFTFNLVQYFGELNVKYPVAKDILVDSIVSNSVSLCEKEINMEDIDGSKEEYKKSLSEKSLDELTPFHPRSIYGVSKVFAFHTAVHYREAYGIFACNGILFNHESPRRGPTFVTKKIVEGLVRIKVGLQKKLTLGNLYAVRDWGHAKDYAISMWKILQYKKPDDWVIATNKENTVKKFIEVSAKKLSIKIKWVGKGINEKGVDVKSGKTIIDLDKKYLRPTEVEFLKGNYSKARRHLKWKPSISTDKLVDDMINFEMNKYSS